MAEFVFPSLPSPLGGSFSESELSSWVEDRGEVGAPDRRNRFTRPLEMFSFKLRLTNDQKETLMSFYKDDLSRGVSPFTWTHPTNGQAFIVQFTQRPSPAHVAGSIDIWDVDISLQEV